MKDHVKNRLDTMIQPYNDTTGQHYHINAA